MKKIMKKKEKKVGEERRTRKKRKRKKKKSTTLFMSLYIFFHHLPSRTLPPNLFHSDIARGSNISLTPTVDFTAVESLQHPQLLRKKNPV